jgi:hypothetical protein
MVLHIDFIYIIAVKLFDFTHDKLYIYKSKT